MKNHIFQTIDNFTNFEDMSLFHKIYCEEGAINWRYKNTGLSKKYGIDSFCAGLPEETIKTIPFIKSTQEKIEKIMISFNNKLQKIHFNGHSPGQDGTLHTDHNKGSLTALLFTNPEWINWWGGEFLLYDSKGEEVIDACSYKPNRLVIFSSHLPHRGIGPIHTLNGVFRVSVAFQFILDS
jgi:hypothetical protein